LVRRGTTKNQLEKRMDQLHTITNRIQNLGRSKSTIPATHYQ